MNNVICHLAKLLVTLYVLHGVNAFAQDDQDVSHRIDLSPVSPLQGSIDAIYSFFPTKHLSLGLLASHTQSSNYLRIPRLGNGAATGHAFALQSMYYVDGLQSDKGSIFFAALLGGGQYQIKGESNLAVTAHTLSGLGGYDFALTDRLRLQAGLGMHLARYTFVYNGPMLHDARENGLVPQPAGRLTLGFVW